MPMSLARGGDTTVVPTEGMVIVNGTYHGISKDWYEEYNPSNEVLSISLKIPSNVTAILNDGFRDSWSNAKEDQDVITDRNYDGDKKYTDKYVVVSIDFSEASNLKTIGEQAALGEPLTGVLDLSTTKVETIGKSAFSECTGIEGVILPSTLKNIGSEKSGSVFNGCSGLQFVRVSNSDATFELPSDLEVIGQQSFQGCNGLPLGTQVTIPAKVTTVGSQAFYNSRISTIFIETDDASGYHGGAFKADPQDYGLNARLVVFKDSSSKATFTPSGFTSYKNAITYEFTLHYGMSDGHATENKLWGQRLEVCKNDSGKWYVNEDYSIPPCDGKAPIGYDLGWKYDDKILTNSTILKPNGDDLYLDIGKVLKDPDVSFIVDDEVIDVDDTYPKLNLSNDKEHTIGVDVSHPIQNDPNADVKVKFEYEWTDVWKGGSEGPRMSEDGFGRYNPGVGSTITINGPTHERTMTGSYSGADYGDGYYLLEIYGYSCPKTGGSWTLFYKSASTVIGSDSDRTVDTAYLFDVVTSDPAEAPDVSVEDVTVEYGYEEGSAILTAVFIKQSGYTYSYQWYEDGERIEGATDRSYTIPGGKSVGSYEYRVEVTAKKILNGDEAQASDTATFAVKAHEYSITVDPTEHGSYGASTPSAPEGTLVTITANPEIGYHATAPVVKDSSGESLGLTQTDSGWQFTMPASDVSISGSFELDQYTITFIANDEVYWKNQQQYGELIVLPENEPSMPGHVFKGWSEYDEGMIASSNYEFVALFEPISDPSLPEVDPVPPWHDDDDPSYIPPNIVVEKSRNSGNLWIIIVLGSVATLLFLLFAYFERRDREE